MKCMILCVALSLLCLLNEVSSKLYCRTDSECTHFGEFTCIKSFCNWGVCGCPSNKGAKYVGQTDKFKCVPIKKVGEYCSNSGDSGICGAENSYCDETDHVCKCDTNTVPIWGGERCASVRSTSVGETCSSASAIGNCGVDASTCTSTGTNYYGPTDYDVPSCACANNHYMGLSNTFVLLRSTSTLIPFVHRIQPQCVPILHGDPCVFTADCGGSGMTCDTTTFKCACTTSGHVPSYDRTACNQALAFGAACASPASGFHCDGSIGLTCGDQCAVTGTNELTDSTRTCTCGPFHTMSGTTCTAIGSGSTCFGDYNCKGWSLDGICVDSKCVQGAGVKVTAVLITVLLPLLVIFL